MRNARRNDCLSEVFGMLEGAEGRTEEGTDRGTLRGLPTNAVWGAILNPEVQGGLAHLPRVHGLVRRPCHAHTSGIVTKPYAERIGSKNLRPKQRGREIERVIKTDCPVAPRPDQASSSAG